MSVSFLSDLSRLDVWLLARCAVGYRAEPGHMREASPDVTKLLLYLDGINYRDRELLMRQNLSPDDFNRVCGCDPESKCPIVENENDFEIVDIKDLDKLPPLRWIIPGEIPESGMTMLFGESNVGKSFVALDYALRVAAERDVLYVLGEGVGGIRKRVYGWCHHHRKDYRHFRLKFVMGLVDLFDHAGAARFIAAVTQLQPYMIVVDTLSLVTGAGDENSARDMNILLRHCLMAQRATDTAFLFIHHTGKDGNKERGSGALKGRVDTMIQVVPADDLIAVESVKSRDEKRFETRYLKLLPIVVPEHGDTLVPVPASLMIRSKTDPLTPDQRKILDVMALEVYADGITLRELSEAARLSIRSVQSALSNLVKKECVYKPPKGSYTITDAGRNAIGLESLNRAESGLESGSLNSESLNRAKHDFSGSDSSDSADSSDSSDSAIQRGENDADPDSIQQLTWDELTAQAAPRRAPNQYERGY